MVNSAAIPHVKWKAKGTVWSTHFEREVINAFKAVTFKIVIYLPGSSRLQSQIENK